MDQIEAWLFLALTFLLIAANGYFVAQEFAFVAVNRPEVEHQAQNDDRSAIRVRHVLRKLSFMLSGAQLGITVTSLVVGFIADKSLGVLLTPVLELFGIGEVAARGAALTIAFVIMTFTQMVLAELFPKNLAIAKPMAISRSIAFSTIWWLRIAGPVIKLFDGAANALIRSIGVEPIHELAEGASAEELEHIVQASKLSGQLDDELVSLFTRAIGFRDLDAGAVAVDRANMITVSPVETLATVHSQLVATGLSRYPVVDPKDRLPIGVVDISSLVRTPRNEWHSVRVSSVMHPAPAIPDTAHLGNVLAVLRESKSQIALVINERGSLMGMLTLEDLLEELVGEIFDEHDKEIMPMVVKDGEFSWLIEGEARIDEVERDTGLALPNGDYDTIAGLFISQLGRLSKVGDSVELSCPNPNDSYRQITVELKVLKASKFATEKLLLSYEGSAQ